MKNRIEGTSDPDTLIGVAGRDLILGKGGSDTLFAATVGTDPSEVGKDILKGGGGSDVINIDGEGSNQKAFGQNGADLITFGAGKDTVDGGKGDDFLDWSSGLLVREFDKKLDVVTGGKGTDTLDMNLSSLTNVENVTVTSSGEGAYLFFANGNDMVSATEVETIELQLPAGADLLEYQGTDAPDLMALLDGAHTANTGGGDDIITNVLNDELDTFDMGEGLDLLRIFFGDIETDIVVDAAAGTVVSEGEVLVSFSNVEELVISGSGTSNDTILGGDGADVLTGGAGNDSILGNGGDDVMQVSTLNGTQSIVRGGGGTDTVDIFDGSSLGALAIDMTGTKGKTVKVNVDGVETVLAKQTEKVRIDGDDGDDFLLGLALDDSLEGGAGNDTINGKGGDDFITTGGGIDIVNGGGGADTFVFDVGSQGAGNTLKVKDFSAEDGLVLNGFFYFGDDFVAGETPAFISGAGLKEGTGTGSQFVYNTNTGALYLDPDGAGGADADLLAKLKIDGSVADLTVDQIEVV